MVKINPSEITPEHVYLSRRQFIKAGAVAMGALALAACTHSDPSTDTPEGTSDCVSGAAIQEALDDGALSVVVCPGVHAVHLEIPDGVVLEGTGLAADTVLDGTDTGIPVTVMANAEVVLKHLTVTRGVTETPEAAAGVHALTAHSLTLEDCIVENGTGWAGGIAGPIPGLVTLTDVTVQDNVGDGVGGLYGHAMNLTRVTLSGNEGTGDLGTGGLYVLGLVDAPAVAVADALFGRFSPAGKLPYT